MQEQVQQMTGGQLQGLMFNMNPAIMNAISQQASQNALRIISTMPGLNQQQKMGVYQRVFQQSQLAFIQQYQNMMGYQQRQPRPPTMLQHTQAQPQTQIHAGIRPPQSGPSLPTLNPTLQASPSAEAMPTISQAQ
ncbi:hypothetical protein EV182_006399, partial [Spiromyces aspiralis]